MGQFQQGKYEGLGRRILENDDIADGIWKEGKLHDVGIVYNNSKNTYILGCFYDDKVNTIYHKGEEFPYILISIKK